MPEDDSKNTRSAVDEFLSKGFDLQDIKEEYKKFTARSKIEEYGEEDSVIKELMLGKKASYIVETLNLKYPEGNFKTSDVEHFLDRHRELVKYFKEKNNNLAKRHMAARVEVEEELANLALFTRQLVTKYDNNNEPNSTVNAIKALNITIMNYAKIAGFTEAPESKKTENIINVVSERHKSLASKLLQADFKMIDAEVINEEVPIDKKEEEKDGSTGRAEDNKADSA